MTHCVIYIVYVCVIINKRCSEPFVWDPSTWKVQKNAYLLWHIVSYTWTFYVFGSWLNELGGVVLRCFTHSHSTIFTDASFTKPDDSFKSLFKTISYSVSWARKLVNRMPYNFLLELQLVAKPYFKLSSQTSNCGQLKRLLFLRFGLTRRKHFSR